jgi:hypothetical protein
VAPEQRFLSYARNAEDVVLWRALGDVPGGRYVEVGVETSPTFSVTRALRERGWTGVDLPGGSAPELAAALAAPAEDPDDVQLLVVATDGTGPDALTALGEADRRPWVLVLAATGADAGPLPPGPWETTVRAARYELCLFDGVSRFYVAEEHADRLRSALSVPANALDDFVPARRQQDGEDPASAQEVRELRARLDEALADAAEWRGKVLARWSEAVATGNGSGGRSAGHEVVRLREELEATHATFSWRITAPLRAVQARRLQGWR